MNLLFLNVGRRCELVEAYRRAVITRGGGRIHGSDVTERAPALYKVDTAHILPHGSNPEFVGALCKLCTQHDIDLIIPTIDPDLEYLAQHRAEIEQRCRKTRVLLSPSEVIEICRDKRRSKERFAALGAEVPKAADPDDPDAQFPIFMKPARGSASEGIHVIRDHKELAVYRRECADAMFEEVVSGAEYTVDVLCDFQGRALFAVPRKRLKVRGGEVVQGIVERCAELETLAMRLAEGFGCHGPVTLQFRSPSRVNGGVQRFVAIELNARMGGGLPLTIAAGADWPGWILDLWAGKPPNLNVPVRDGLMLLRYDASVFVEAKAPPRPTLEPLRSLKALIFDLDDTLYPERDFVYGGYRAVAEQVYTDHRIDIESTLRLQFEQGARHNVFGMALKGLAVDERYLRRLVDIYRRHRPILRPYVGIATLAEFRKAGLKVALLTDGLPLVQQSKVASLGIEHLFDVIVYSHELGGHETWKPSTVPYERCLRELHVRGPETVYVADNPAKDFRGARELGIWTIRVRQPGTEHARAEPATAADAPHYEISSLHEITHVVPVG